MRNDDLLRTYRKVISGCSHISLYDAVQQTVDSPAQRFYVSEYRARNVIMRMMKDKPLDSNMYPCKKEMFMEIYRRVQALRKSCPEKPILYVIEEVLAQPAPKFYLTKETGVTILHKLHKKKCLEQMQQRLHH